MATQGQPPTALSGFSTKLFSPPTPQPPLPAPHTSVPRNLCSPHTLFPSSPPWTTSLSSALIQEARAGARATDTFPSLSPEATIDLVIITPTSQLCSFLT